MPWPPLLEICNYECGIAVAQLLEFCSQAKYVLTAGGEVIFPRSICNWSKVLYGVFVLLVNTMCPTTLPDGFGVGVGFCEESSGRTENATMPISTSITQAIRAI